ncbi:hypothetical protein REPUB_Repub19eG0082700 [Reevesia pubescens]
MDQNNIRGTIPQEIGKLTSLSQLFLHQNKLSGNVPSSIGNLSNLVNLYLGDNELSGSIPQELGILRSLDLFDLSRNQPTGRIPSSLGNMTSLSFLYLFSNKLSSSIPTELGMLSLIPAGLINITHFKSFELAVNELTGNLLENICLGGLLGIITEENNHFTGPIPKSLKICTSLIRVKLEGNQRQIPKELGKLTSLNIIFLNDNRLSGSLALVFIIVGISLILWKRIWDKEYESREAQTENPFTIWCYDGNRGHSDINKATEGFDTKHCVGVGGFGSVYKAELPTGEVLAIKELHTPPEGGVINLKAFTSEIQALTEIRHRNIVKLYGFCLHPQYCFLAYEFFKGGSLEKLISSEEKAMEFDWIQRINDSKDYEDRISDFGTARLLKPDSSNWTAFAGTFGYSAPGDLISSLSSSTYYHLLFKDVLDQRISPPTHQIVGYIVFLMKAVSRISANHAKSFSISIDSKARFPGAIPYDDIRGGAWS